ncbi:hypothetical protein NPIL_637221 [Nephila pilipes]|uniref:Uncharacterized protein n=1 Tax=Nephila pilipes TaxID=299642 RepID=A0A8X6T214_NEPPI|nr:hypothetical protein NPIL_637221 [Nephila pilipes]
MKHQSSIYDDTEKTTRDQPTHPGLSHDSAETPRHQATSKSPYAPFRSRHLMDGTTADRVSSKGSFLNKFLETQD